MITELDELYSSHLSDMDRLYDAFLKNDSELGRELRAAGPRTIFPVKPQLLHYSNPPALTPLNICNLGLFGLFQTVLSNTRGPGLKSQRDVFRY